MSVIERLKKHILVDGFHVVADVDKSQGSWIVDKDTGKHYLDCYSQFASQALGWNHPCLNEHAAELGKVALHKIANSDMYSEVYCNFVESFATVAPDFKHFFFIDGGALAIENALKACFDWKLRRRGALHGENKLDVIHLEQAFHGRSGYTMSLTNTDWTKTGGFPKFDWTRVPNPKIRWTPWASTDATKRPWCDADMEKIEQVALTKIQAALEHKNGDVAAIILEPIQGEGGDNHFRKEFFVALRQLADMYEAMLIFDEVQTGVGLTGKMWCYEHFGVVPDMMCFGKKTQTCGFCSTNRINEVTGNVFQKSGRINSTWGGNIVDMARAQIIFKIIKDENLVENAAEVGRYLLDGLRTIESDKVFGFRGRGLMIAFDCLNTPSRDSFIGKLQEKMLVLKSGSFSIRLRPHLTMTKDDADKVVQFVKEAL